MSDRGAASEGMRVSRAAAQRLSLYLRCLTAWPSDAEKISSSQIAAAVGVSDAQVRRDLAALGHLGQRGIGYEPRELATAIREALGIHRTWRVVLVGVGNLGRALLRYQGFRAQGFQIVAVFDNQPTKIGECIEGLRVRPLHELEATVTTEGVELAILTVPKEAAQSVADALVRAGIRGILNFAPVVLRLPQHVQLVTVDLAIQLEQLTFLVQHANGVAPPAFNG
ncbi:MAG: redox-sensing transcriptional repressor Rex [Gemmataceae bacterium]|nr:redox-sensing transcriptional repressor Rex [Gemmataceae bacterium]MCS7269535.1 redox-sensing transcriptional repressor Rex [Gemmataceae bacterium]MDW8243931.1 redox-sensing transcriptional repressor Rex [Thermogemmata sp.]